MGLHVLCLVVFGFISSFLEYFAFAPPPFERLLLQGCASDVSGWAPSSHAVIGFLDVLWASYRFLKLEPKVFRELWDWSPVFDLLKYRPLEKDEASLDVRWCAVQIVSLVLQMSDLATRAMSSSVSNLSGAEAFACHLRWDSVSQNVAVEKAGMYLEPTCVVKSSNLEVMELEGGNSFSSEQRHFEGNRCSHVEICGIELPVRHGVQYGR
jgi:midasin